MTTRINPDRLLKSLDEMAAIGATPGGGVTRLSLSDQDAEARNLLHSWMEEAGLETAVDDFGNMTGTRAGVTDDPPVLIGSHLDTVVKGGRFDGALGVLGALEVVRTLNDGEIETTKPVAMVNWTDEEGARFQPAMLGSGAATDVFEKHLVYERIDLAGLDFKSELNRIGYAGSPDNRPNAASAYLELHVEQGPRLETSGTPVAVVEGIVGITWLGVTITGTSNHAGTTAMTLRHDPLVAAGSIMSAVRDIAIDQGGAGVGTVGRVVVDPNVTNTIPSRVTFTVDFRHPDADALNNMVTRLTDLVEASCKAQGVDGEVVRHWTSLPTAFDPAVVFTISTSCQTLGVEFETFWSGAGHDAKYLADICPAGMIFVRSQGGLSHAEGEESSPEDCADGVDVLLESTLRLAGRG